MPAATEEDVDFADNSFDGDNGIESFNGDEVGIIDVMNGTANAQLRSVVERIERLEEDKAAVAADIKEVKAEAKGNGFDVKIINAVVRRRKQDRAKRQEEEALLDLYEAALEMVKP